MNYYEIEDICWITNYFIYFYIIERLQFDINEAVIRYSKFTLEVDAREAKKMKYFKYGGFVMRRF